MTRLKRQKMEEAELYNWMFHYNSYAKSWNGFHREDYFAYWNGKTPVYAILKAKDIYTIQEIIKRTGGDKSKVNELVRRIREKKSGQ